VELKHRVVRTLTALAALLLCSTAVARPPTFVRTSGTRFIDPNGKVLILHGINVANKNPKQGYMGDFGASDLDAIRSWGMNCIRLVILWDGLEPEPGKINKSYLDRIAKVVELAKSRGIYVLLDMHQDLYSVKFSDGAPAWATLDEGKPFAKTPVWSDAYSTSQAVQTALDHFWANTPGPDGIGLQDHYAHVWHAVATRFASEPDVLGYDLMNEPPPGADYARARQAGMAAVVRALAKRDGAKAPDTRQSAAIMAKPEGLKQFESWLSDPLIFRAMINGMASVTQNFERTELMPFYTKVARSIRQADPNHILFIEPVILSGLGVPSAVTALRNAQGKRDPQQAFAPHCYDITTDRGPVDPAGESRLKIILSNHNEESRALRMPLLIGEWGAFYLNGGAAETARFLISQFNRIRCGDMYWSYSRKLANSPLLPALTRSTHLDAPSL
jgi:endoglycosylceramidase